MKITSNKVTQKVIYGRLYVDTKYGVLEYSYETGTNTEPYSQLEKGEDIFSQLTDEEQDQLSELITNEIF